MTGKTHKAVGVVTGLSMAVYGVATGNWGYLCGMFTAPIGAMFPDIDHSNSKIGKQRKNLFRIVKLIAIGGLITSAVLAAIAMGFGLKDKLLTFVAALAGSCLLVLIALSDTLKKRFPFLTKHRGIMHTLVVPMVVMFLCSKTSISVLQAIGIGFALGYISHIQADCLTTMGSPVCWPLSEECVSYFDVVTGTIKEYIAAALLSGAIIGYTILVIMNKDNAVLIVTLLLIPLGNVLIKILDNILKRSKLKPIHFVLVLAVLSIISIFKGPVIFKVSVISLLIGTLQGIRDLKHRKTKSKKSGGRHR